MVVMARGMPNGMWVTAPKPRFHLGFVALHASMKQGMVERTASHHTASVLNAIACCHKQRLTSESQSFELAHDCDESRAC